eukprot:11114743-Karenia_brevis.AAC.1
MSPAAKAHIPIGSPVVLQGLVSRPELNGKHGTIGVGSKTDGDRFAVLLNERGESILVKSDNIKAAVKA